MAFKMMGMQFLGAGGRKLHNKPEDQRISKHLGGGVSNIGPFSFDDKRTKSNPNAREQEGVVNKNVLTNPERVPKKQDKTIKLKKSKPTSVKTTSGSSADKIVRSKPDTKKSNSRYDTKTKTGRNLLGQKRNVTKYYDKETGRKVGKKVQVEKKGGKLKSYKDRHGNYSTEKTKRVNTGLSREGGVGKIREKAGYFDSPAGETTATTGKPGRIEHSASRPELKEFVKKDTKTGEDKLASYNEAWDDGRFDVKDGMRTDKFGNKYADTPEGKDKFKESSRSFWSGLADKTQNEELRRDTQTGKMDSPMPKKKKGYKMKGSPFNIYNKPKGKRTKY